MRDFPAPIAAICSPSIFPGFMSVRKLCASVLCLFFGCDPRPCLCAGQLVWRRFEGLPAPSSHAIRAACMQLLPVVEMYCKYMLQEDCGNLRALMLRFDDEEELQTHDLGRSLLFMIRDDESGLESFSRRSNAVAPQNPFDAVRAGIAAVDLAFVGLRPQGQVAPGLYVQCNLRVLIVMQLRSADPFTQSRSRLLHCLCCASVCCSLSLTGCRVPIVHGLCWLLGPPVMLNSRWIDQTVAPQFACMDFPSSG